jgi:hypothetical protein
MGKTRPHFEFCAKYSVSLQCVSLFVIMSCMHKIRNTSVNPLYAEYSSSGCSSLSSLGTCSTNFTFLISLKNATMSKLNLQLRALALQEFVQFIINSTFQKIVLESLTERQVYFSVPAVACHFSVCFCSYYFSVKAFDDTSQLSAAVCLNPSCSSFTFSIRIPRF